MPTCLFTYFCFTLSNTNLKDKNGLVYLCIAAGLVCFVSCNRWSIFGTANELEELFSRMSFSMTQTPTRSSRSSRTHNVTEWILSPHRTADGRTFTSEFSTSEEITRRRGAAHQTTRWKTHFLCVLLALRHNNECSERSVFWSKQTSQANRLWFQLLYNLLPDSRRGVLVVVPR